MMQPESQKLVEQRARDMARLCAEELLKDPDDERVITGIFRNIPLQQLIEASDKCVLLEQQLAEARKDTERLLALKQPWPLRDVLAKLSEATCHLLAHHDCDCHGYEEYSRVANRAVETLPVIDTITLAMEKGSQ